MVDTDIYSRKLLLVKLVQIRENQKDEEEEMKKEEGGEQLTDHNKCTNSFDLIIKILKIYIDNNWTLR